MPDSDHTAVGQALGYVYQFDRATFRLLEASNSVVSVGVEHIDDVSIHRLDGTAIQEQDKSTVTSKRPLTDLSVALWKTLAIWAEQLKAVPSIVASTDFHLVTNGDVARDSLAARIHAATTASDAASVAQELLSISRSLRDELVPFGEKLHLLGPDLLRSLISRISVFDHAAPTSGDKLEEVPSLRYFSPLQRTAVFNNAAAWVRERILAAATNGEPTTIDRLGFDQQVRALLRHVSVAPLAMMFEVPTTDLDPSQYSSFGFFQQLDWVDTDPSLVRDCVIHYAQARHTRAKWAETDSVAEGILRSYEDELQFRWKLLAGRQMGRVYSSPAIQGQELLSQTLSEETMLQGQQLPKAFTCGSFHALADFDHEQEPTIGWHPGFRDKAKGTKEES